MKLKEAIGIAKIIIGIGRLLRSPKCNITPFEQDAIQLLISLAENVLAMDLEKVLREVDKNPYCSKLGMPARRKHYIDAIRTSFGVEKEN